jgi:hypothetical protein
MVGQPQVPAVHTRPIPQRVPQVPQLPVSVWRLTHRPLHEVCPLGHAHRPAAQVWPVPQRVPQVPQLFASV